MCMGILPACISVHHVCAMLSAFRGQKRAPDPLEWKLQTVANSYVNAGNQTLVLRGAKSTLKAGPSLQSHFSFFLTVLYAF